MTGLGATSNCCPHRLSFGECGVCTPRRVQQGWQCPGCGACYAPWMPQCATCKPRHGYVQPNGET